MGLNKFDRNGAFEELLGYEQSGTFTKGTSEGLAAAMTTDGKVKVGGDGDVLRGKIRTFQTSWQGGEVSVQTGGLAEFTYTGSAPTAGAWNLLECGAAGVVQIDATNGHEFFVETVDTTALTCVVVLPG